MELILYIAIGIIIFAEVGCLIAKAKPIYAIQVEKDAALHKFNELEKVFVSYKATPPAEFQKANENLDV